MGPLALASIRDGVAEQVDRSVAAGARLLTGGRRLEGPGYFYPPTVLADVPPDAPAAREEVFGPVAAVFRVARGRRGDRAREFEPFGLGAAAWTRDARRPSGWRTSSKPEACSSTAWWRPTSGFRSAASSGRATGASSGSSGLREFVNIKTVRMADLG